MRALGLATLLVPMSAAAGPAAGVRAGLVGNDYRVPSGSLVGIEADLGEPGRVWRYGGALQYAAIESTSSDTRLYDGQVMWVARAGARAEAHVPAAGRVDPWLGLGAGLFYGHENRSESRPEHAGVGVDLTLELGVDVHLGGGVALGVLLGAVVPLTASDHVGGDGSVGDGVYGSVFDDIPAPTLRLRYRR